jgi:hypothetical protein
MGFECRISVGKLSYKNCAISYYSAIIFADVKEPFVVCPKHNPTFQPKWMIVPDIGSSGGAEARRNCASPKDDIINAPGINLGSRYWAA